MTAAEINSNYLEESKNEMKVLLHSIYDNLSHCKNEIKDLDLYAGKLGCVLFLFYYSQIQDKHSNEDEELLEVVLDDLASLDIQTVEGFILYSHLGLVIQTLLDEDPSKFAPYKTLLPDIDKLLYSPMQYWMNDLNFDFLRGSTNIALYYYLRNKHEYVTVYIESLCANIEEYLTKHTNLNFGVAHGIGGILLFLINYLSLGDNTLVEKIKNICTTCVKTLFSCNQPAEDDLSYFRKDQNTLAYNSKLGWCQGDLSTTYLLGKLYNRFSDVLSGEMIHHLDHRTLARSFRENTSDYCLCHGATGISLLYYLQYNETKKEDYRPACMYWLKRAMDLYQTGERNPLYKPYGLGVGMLLGDVGIGLYLLLLLNKKRDKWLKLLLLK